MRINVAEAAMLVVKKVSTSAEVWHKRFGYLSYTNLQKTAKIVENIELNI